MIICFITAIRDHAKVCHQKLMKKSLFSFGDDPTAPVVDVNHCFIQVQAETHKNMQ